MRLGVNYDIKHSQEFLYKKSNESDLKNYEITRIPLPSKIKMLEESVSLIEEKKEVVKVDETLMFARLEKRELVPIT